MSYKKKLSPHLFLAKKYWSEHLSMGDFVIDATLGNGHDSLFLSKLVINNESGCILGIDIQEEAIVSSKNKMQHELDVEIFQRINLKQMSHADIDKIVYEKKPKLIVYNLGYLPGQNKNITTLTETTISSLEKALNILADDGAISVTCYPRHEEGSRETQAVYDFLTKLDPKLWSVCKHEYINKPYCPVFIWIASCIK